MNVLYAALAAATGIIIAKLVMPSFCDAWWCLRTGRVWDEELYVWTCHKHSSPTGPVIRKSQ